MLCRMYEICYQSCMDSDVCTYMSDRLDINYRIIPHSSQFAFAQQFCKNRIFRQRNMFSKYFQNMLHTRSCWAKHGNVTYSVIQSSIMVQIFLVASKMGVTKN